MTRATDPAPDLLLTGARVVDPRNGVDAVADVEIRDARIAAVGKDLPRRPGVPVRALDGMLVVPGLIDLHTHVYHKATSYGVDPDAIALRSVLATMVDAGSAGAGTYAGFRDFVMRGARTRLLAWLNVSFPGIFAFERGVMVGEAANEALLSVEHCRAVAQQNPDTVVGIKVRLGAAVSGDVGLRALDRALAVAEPLGLPVMTHIGAPQPGYAEILARMRAGDVLTHCFRPAPNAPVDADGKILPALREARARGVLFDVGHGMGAFSFASTQAALDDGFAPDIVSSDVHALTVNGPGWDLLHVMSKLLNCGIDLVDLVRMTTDAPARAIGRADASAGREPLGALGVGAPADLAVLRVADVPLAFVDVAGARRDGVRLLRAVGLVRAGRWHDPTPRPWEESSPNPPGPR
ncbi:MAG: amidohydrolase/deacetylase family metallohydrolase [Lautropia sp.]